MRVLIYGAGVIGCFLAHTLYQAKQEVSVLARGSWKATLEENGLVIQHYLQRKTTVNHLHVVETIDPAEYYDIVFAVMQYQQMGDILDDLAKVNAPIVVLVGNNLSALDMESYILTHTEKPKTVLFGFQATGGRREDGKVICVRFGGGSMSIGGLHGEVSDSIKANITTVFKGTKYSLNWMPDMDAWYKCHAAFILPIAYLCYTLDCNLRKSNCSQRKQLLDAANEAYGLLKKMGYLILPYGEETYYQQGKKRKIMAVMLFFMAKTKIGDLAASDHCRHAVTEMEAMDRAWIKMKNQRPDIYMPNWDALHTAMPSWNNLKQKEKK